MHSSKKENRAYRAKQLRYKRAALSLVQHDRIYDELYDIYNECSELEWSVEDDETLLDALGGDSEDIYEFRMMFSDLSNKCDQLMSAIRDEYVIEHFDDFFVGVLGNAYKIVGYDSFEEDYFNLTRFEADLAQGVSGKRLMGLTKEKLISVAGQCFGVMMSFLDIRHSYDCLKAAFDALRDDRAELLRDVKTVEDAYEKMIEDPYNWELRSQYDALLANLPDRVWIE